MCRGEIFDESGSGNNGISRGRVIVEAGYNQDNGVDLSDGFIQLDGMNFKVCYCPLVSVSNRPRSSPGQGHCVEFLGKTRNSHSASLHPDV